MGLTYSSVLTAVGLISARKSAQIHLERVDELETLV